MEPYTHPFSQLIKNGAAHTHDLPKTLQEDNWDKRLDILCGFFFKFRPHFNAIFCTKVEKWFYE